MDTDNNNGPTKQEVDAAVGRARCELGDRLQRGEPPTPAEIAGNAAAYKALSTGNDNDALGIVETIAIVRHLRWGYVGHGLMWWIIAAGILFLEPLAAALGQTFVWIFSLAAWGAGLWGTVAFGMALLSDKRLLELFKQQTRS